MTLRSLGQKLRPSNRIKVRLPPKKPDPELLTPEHKAFREAVLKRAGFRCEWVENGKRCWRKAPDYRLIADHIEERKDGGALVDISNGQCLCVSHNTLKGARARAARMHEGIHK